MSTREEAILSTVSNSSFSKVLPGLQLGVDSTSLGEFKQCPRKYFYSIIQGWQQKKSSVHLVFGILLHSAREAYDKAAAGGASHEVALEATVAWAMRATWDKALGRGWVSGDSHKNRLTLIRSIIWYLDHYGANDPVKTTILPDGSPAVELSFSFPSGYSASTGEDILLCGHLDRVAEFNDDFYISDIKTTQSELGDYYFARFTPDNQFSLYTVAGRVAFSFQTKGIILDALQVGVEFTRFHRKIIPRSKAVQEEWLAGTQYWLRQMEEAALAGHWPMNDKSCGMFASKENPGGCPFREVCSKDPASREIFLKQGFTRRIWDPLVPRNPPAAQPAQPDV